MDASNRGIEWSYSNAMRYESCPRSLFYHYWHHQQDGQRKTEKSYADEYVWYSSLGSLIGTAVHEGISTQINRWSHGESTSRDEAHKQAVGCIEAASRPKSITSNRQNKWRSSLIETATDHLDRFLSVIWPQLRTGRYILHEQLDSIRIDDITVWVRPDLCHRDPDGNFVVTDWKTRQPEVFEDPTLQLRTYTLWAQQVFEPNIDRIKIQLAFSSTGEIQVQSVSKADLDAVRNRIRSDTESWQNPSQQSAFPADPTAEKCGSCSYLSACAVGQDIIDQ